MRDPEGFKPYMAGVPGVIKNFGCTYLARGGAVTPLGGAFAPDRLVLMQFPSADELVDFYFSDGYAPLLPIRLKTTVPRFVVMARSGKLPDRARGVIAEKLPGRWRIKLPSEGYCRLFLMTNLPDTLCSLIRRCSSNVRGFARCCVCLRLRSAACSERSCSAS